MAPRATHSIPRLIAVAVAVAALVAAAAAAARPGRSPGWTIQISGVQTLEWEHTSYYDQKADQPIESCSLRHAGHQVIRFGTPGAVAATLGKQDYTTDMAYVRFGGRLHGYVPLVGSETRSHTTLAPPALDGCLRPAQVAAIRACSGTRPLIPATGVVLHAKTVGGRSEVEIHVPAGFGFQPSFPDCNLLEFNERNYFESSIGTGAADGIAWKPVRGNVRSPSTKQVVVEAEGVGCLDEDFPRFAAFTSCSGAHAAKLAIRWRIVMRRL